MDSKELNFSLVRKEREVTIEGERYVLIELDGFGRDKYLNNLGNRVRITANGKAAGIKNFDGMEASLVAECLKKVEGEERKTVSMAVIQKWPSRVITAIYEAAKELSGVDADKEEAPKKDDDTADEDAPGEVEEDEGKND